MITRKTFGFWKSLWAHVVARPVSLRGPRSIDHKITGSENYDDCRDSKKSVTGHDYTLQKKKTQKKKRYFLFQITA
jgi:hypothetical protein